MTHRIGARGNRLGLQRFQGLAGAHLPHQYAAKIFFHVHSAVQRHGAAAGGQRQVTGIIQVGAVF